MAGKGDKNRVRDLEAYRSSPLWDNLKKKKYESYTEFSNDFTPLVENIENNKIKRFLCLDDERKIKNCYLYDEQQLLTVASGVSEFEWDIVRSYDEFVDYVEKYGIPDIVSFDNDLDTSMEGEHLKKFDKAHDTGFLDWESCKTKTGIHCAKWLIDKCKELNADIPKYYVHSANTFARPIIREIMESGRIKN